MAIFADVDTSTMDFTRLVADKAAIQQRNPHRDHMYHLDGIVYCDFEKQRVVGYKDVRPDEFWVSGHMPGYPLFPGVIMCEAAAQMASWYTKELGIFGPELLGLGGIDDARFRGSVRPGDRLVMIGKGIRISKRICVFDVQGFVEDKLCFECRIIGVPIPGGEIIAAAIQAGSGS